MKTLLCLAVVLLPSLSAAADIQITYHSDPEGATLYALNAQQAPERIGYTPITLKYKIARSVDCVRLNRTSVRWASGVEASVNTLMGCKAKTAGKAFTFLRPAGLPGAEIDAQFAAYQAQVEAANQQARNAILAAYFLKLNQPAPPLQPFALQPVPAPMALPRPLTCTSQVVGAMIYTTCN